MKTQFALAAALSALVVSSAAQADFPARQYTCHGEDAHENQWTLAISHHGTQTAKVQIKKVTPHSKLFKTFTGTYAVIETSFFYTRTQYPLVNSKGAQVGNVIVSEKRAIGRGGCGPECGGNTLSAKLELGSQKAAFSCESN